jgi:hypothetical protein
MNVSVLIFYLHKKFLHLFPSFSRIRLQISLFQQEECELCTNTIITELSSASMAASTPSVGLNVGDWHGTFGEGEGQSGINEEEENECAKCECAAMWKIVQKTWESLMASHWGHLLLLAAANDFFLRIETFHDRGTRLNNPQQCRKVNLGKWQLNWS